jgi:hypothetical protein
MVTEAITVLVQEDDNTTVTEAFKLTPKILLHLKKQRKDHMASKVMKQIILIQISFYICPMMMIVQINHLWPGNDLK